MENKNLIGNNIKLLRKSQGLSQKNLVAKLNLLNIQLDEPMLSRIEHQKRPLFDYEILAFSKALNVSIDTLFKK